jgi:gamma-glutamylaminecyclotransferase
MALLFVYGSLKQGFPNAHVNQGRRVAGTYQTVQPHPFYLLNGRLPCLFPQPGHGLQVRGQLFEVGERELALMDALERVDEPGGYRRVVIAVQAVQGHENRTEEAFVYVQDPALLQAPGPHPGPLSEYTLEHARHLRW